MIRSIKLVEKIMNGIFTLPYSEYEVINTVQQLFKKNEGYSVYIPTSRQQKGIDFIVYNYKTNKVLRFQVKSSRTYVHEAKVLRNGEIEYPKYRYNLWFNNFIEKYEEGIVDYYILFGVYPLYDPSSLHQKNIKNSSSCWKKIILCYTEKEMFELLRKVKTKKEQKTDKFFSYGFNEEDLIYVVRGIVEPVDASEHLLKNKLFS